MLVRKIMKILSNLLGIHSKINANEIAYKNNDEVKLLDDVIADLESRLNINSFETITSGSITGGGTLSGINVTVAKNSDGSLAKIYGQIDVTTGGKTGSVTFNTSLRPKTNLNITGTIYRSISNGGYIRNTALVSMTIGTDGVITIPYVYSINASDSCRLSLLACLIFVKDFGD